MPHHPLCPENIDPFVYSIIEKLQQAGFLAYIVGGGVRDQLVGLSPKDFDVATDAHPEQVRALFSNSRLIGRRFRLAHVYQRRQIIEVATFRAEHGDVVDDDVANTREGIITRDNVYGTLDQDMHRRDFTLNALYYDPVADQIIDKVGGQRDIASGIVRMIGDPLLRLSEDPVRILRAIRIANKLQFQIDPAILAAFPMVIPRLRQIPAGRLFDEYTKLFLHGQGRDNFESLCKHHVFEYLFPHTAAWLEQPAVLAMIERAIDNTDERLQSGSHVNPAFLLAVFLWPVQQANYHLTLEQSPSPPGLAFAEAVNITLAEHIQHISMPRRFSDVIRPMWHLQYPLEQRHPGDVLALLSHPRFRAAYDFLKLRVCAGEVPEALVEWWTAIQVADNEGKAALIAELPVAETHRPPRKRRRRRRKSHDTASPSAHQSGTSQSEHPG